MHCVPMARALLSQVHQSGIVCSKILGIGSVERAWKDVKKIKMPSRNRTLPERTRRMTTIVGHHCANRAARRREREARAGRLWDEADFATLKLDKYGIDTEVLARTKKPKRIFRALLEGWEDLVLKNKDPVFEARVVKKYGGLKWRDPDNMDRLTTAHPKRMYYHREKGKDRGNSGYFG